MIGTPGKSLASWGTFKGAAEAGLVGGVAAEITGGKFDDGFTVSAAGYIFNSAADELKNQRALHLAAVDLAVKDLTAEGFYVQGTEVYATNSKFGFRRFYDIVAVDPEGAEVGFEVKTTSVGNLRLVTSQVAFDAVTSEYPGTTTAFTQSGPVLIDKVGYLGYYKQGVAAATWQAGLLQDTLKAMSISTQIKGSVVAPLPLPPGNP
jgi:hypothetical protein